jgi:hypothetical protein
MLRKTSNFLGIYSSDQLKNLCILKFPAFIIINLETSDLPGSHWLAVRFGSVFIEIFDSLGFDPHLWRSFPTGLLKFLSSYSFTHRYRISPVIQPSYSYTCGLYAIFFILYRQTKNFTACCSKFSPKLRLNDTILFQFFNKN